MWRKISGLLYNNTTHYTDHFINIKYSIIYYGMYILHRVNVYHMIRTYSMVGLLVGLKYENTKTQTQTQTRLERNKTPVSYHIIILGALWHFVVVCDINSLYVDTKKKYLQ